MKKPLRTKLYDLIKAKGSISYGEMCGFVAEEGYKVSTGERRLRELVEDGKVEPVVGKSRRNTDYISGYKLPEPVTPKTCWWVVEPDGSRKAVFAE